jgi:RNA polymerase sigma-70 factor, ECF subfamily
MRTEAGAAVAVSWTADWDVWMKRPERAEAAAPPEADVRSLEACDDAALVRLFLDGRREAFDAIVLRHQRNVYFLCRRFVSTHEDAADLAQDVFVRAFRGLRGFKGDSALGTWLYRVAVNVCLNHSAVKRPAPVPLEEAPIVDTRAVDPLDRVVRGERAEIVRHAIAKLPPKQRATVVLRIYHDMSHEEISNVLETSVGAAKANLCHALQRLKRMLGAS